MNNHQTVKEFFFQTDPIHIFEYNGRIAFLAQDTGAVLGISDVNKGVRQSKVLEKGVDYDVASVNLLPETDKLSVSDAPRVTVLHISGFFLFVLRSNKDIAIPFTRWAIREAIPLAMTPY